MAHASLFHEAPLEVLRESPDVVVDLLALLGHPLQAGPHLVDAVDPDVSEVVPSHRAADFVALVRGGAEHAVTAVVVIEVQRRIDPDKGYAWAQYCAGLAAAHRVPVQLVVWTFDQRVASWARGGFSLGAARVTPLVLGPRDLRRMGEIAEAHGQPELVVLSALTRLGGAQASSDAAAREAVRAAGAVLKLRDTARRRLYASLLHGTARGRVRAILEEFLEVHGMGALEMIRKEGWEEGRHEGRVQALLRQLRRRGFTVDAALERRVATTQDDDRLDLWLDRVLDARSLDEVFTDR